MVCTLYVYMYMTIITGIVYFMLILFIIYTEGTAYDLTQGVASGPYGRHTIRLFIRCIVYTLYCVYYIIALLYAYIIYYTSCMYTGDPNRFDGAPQPADNLTRTDIIQGSYERSISLFRTSYSFVAVARPPVPDVLALLWFAQYAPSSSSYTPLYVRAVQAPPTHSR